MPAPPDNLPALILKYTLRTMQEQVSLALDSAKTSKMRWNGYDIPVLFPFTLCEFAGYFERVGGRCD